MSSKCAFGILFAIGVLAVASGCSRGVSAIPTGAQNAQSIHATRPTVPPPVGCPSSGVLLFVSDFTGDVVDVFESNGSQCATITGQSGPQGVAYSQAFNKLYVANSGTSQVLIYLAPFFSFFKALDDSPHYATGIALCKGYTAVTNLFEDSISIFKGGGTTPVSTLTDAKANSEYFATCDSNGDLFTDYLDSMDHGHVNEFVNGTGNPVEKSIKLKMPGGMEWVNGTLMILDQATRVIKFSKAPYNTVFKTLALTKAEGPVTFEENPSDQDVEVADSTLAVAQEYKLTGGFVGSIPVGGEPIGIAFNKKP